MYLFRIHTFRLLQICFVHTHTRTKCDLQLQDVIFYFFFLANLILHAQNLFGGNLTACSFQQAATSNTTQHSRGGGILFNNYQRTSQGTHGTFTSLLLMSPMSSGGDIGQPLNGRFSLSSQLKYCSLNKYMKNLRTAH